MVREAERDRSIRYVALDNAVGHEVGEEIEG